MVRLFVITRGTKDFGDKFVVREHRGQLASLDPLAVVDSLEEARGAIEEASPSLVRLPPHEMDDPVILESWGSKEDVEHLTELRAALETGAFV